MNRYQWILSVLCPMLLISAARDVHAQTANAQSAAAEADKAYTSASELSKAGNYKEACPLFQKSFELDPSAASTLYYLADCYAHTGEIASAVQRYEEYLRLIPTLPTAKQVRHAPLVAEAKAQVQALQPQIPKVSFTIEGTLPPDARVERDGKELNPSALSGQLNLDPGEHTIRVLISGQPPVEARFSLNKGENKTVELNLTPPPEPKPAPAPPPPLVVEKPRVMPPSPIPPEAHQNKADMTGMRIGAYTLGTVGLFGLGMGGTFGILALRRGDSVKESCPKDAATGNGGCATDEQKNAYNRAYSLGTLSTAGLIAGGIALGGAGALWLLDSKAKGFRDMSGMGIGGHAVLGVGLLSLGMGVALGGTLVSERDDYLGQCIRKDSKLLCATDEAKEAAEEAQTLGTLATAGLITGGAAIAGGVVLLALAPKAKGGSEPKMGRLQLDVVRVDKTGAFAGIKGEWE